MAAPLPLSGQIGHSWVFSTRASRLGRSGIDLKFLIGSVLGPRETGHTSMPLCLHLLAGTWIYMQIPVAVILGNHTTLTSTR